MKKNLLLTYDYELFLGRQSGTAEDCLLRPTNEILRGLNDFGVKGIFFTDTTYLLRLAEQGSSMPASRADFDVVKDQIQRLVAGGHYVYPHIHPHWLDAVYLKQSNQWRLTDPARYRFHNCTPGERDSLFDGSMQLLKEIIDPVSPGYALDCFRAGGWCIQPLSDFRKYFIKYQIRYDMTVLPGFYSFTDAQHFDFSTAPAKTIYRFDEDVCSEDDTGPFTEFTISSVQPGPLTRLAEGLYLKAVPRLLKDGVFTRGSGYNPRPLAGQELPATGGEDLLNSRNERIAVELLSPFKLPVYKRYLESHDYMHFISHPKMITPRHLKYFHRFMDFAVSSTDLESDFKKMTPDSSSLSNRTPLRPA